MDPKTISHYEILGKIGSGGMGVVYKARDTRLNREVAIKVLPAERVSNPEVRARFEREARTISSLNHPHICTLYDVGREVDGSAYLVMENVEGKPLKGPMPVEEALEFAVQIAEALNHAHRRGVIHRDIKPGNILITKRGAKLLDFGLARFAEPPKVMAEETSDSQDLTVKGSILGTVRFMAPEQWEGKDADARTDIFAFGAVLYEVLTGRKAFDSKSRVGLIADIMHKNPQPASEIDSLIPRVLERLIQKCLEKNPDERWQSASDLKDELQWILEATPTQAYLPVPPAVNRQMRKLRRAAKLLAGGLVGAVLLATVFLILWIAGGDMEAPVRKLSLMPGGLSGGSLQISPDGRRVLFSAGTPQRLWIQDLDQQEPRELPGTEGARYPFWSPDGSFVAFAQDNELKKVTASGGPVVTVCPLPGPAAQLFTGSWVPDGRSILFSAGTPHRIYRAPAGGGSPELVAEPGENENGLSYAFPQLLREGGLNRVLLFYSGTVTRGRIVALDLVTGQREELIQGGPFVYSPTGHILYQKTRDDSGILFALPFSVGDMKVTGEPFPVAQHAAFPSLSADGTLVYLDTRGRVDWQLVARDRGGKMISTIGQPQPLIWDPALSPDNLQVAVVAREQERDIWIHEMERPVKSSLTFDPLPEYGPIWMRSGSVVTFTALHPEGREVFFKTVGGAGEVPVLMEGAKAHMVSDWSADGSYMLFSRVDPQRGRDLWYLHNQAGGTVFESAPFLETRSNEEAGKFSPDGRFVVYVSDESGANEIYVQPFPEGRGKWHISSRGGTQPRWSRGGKEIFYVEGNRLMSVPVNTAKGFSVGAPAALFEGGGFRASQSYAPQYDVSADGQMFVVVEPAGEEPRRAIGIHENWFAEFRGRK